MGINRRDFCVAGLSLAAGPALAAAGTEQASPRKPNVILIMADQLRYQSCGYGGDEKAHTPNLDRLAAEGVNFRQAVTSMPVCSAYRASLFTSKYTTSTGMVINELRMNPNHTCLGHCLTRGGYDTGYIGKWHLYANQLGDHFNPKNSFVPRGPDRLGFDGYWAAYNFHHDYYGSYYHTESTDKIFYGEDVFEPDAQTDLAIRYLKDDDRAKKPWSLVLSYGTPHDPWVPNNVPEKYLDMFKDVDFPLPDNYSEEMDPYGDGWSNINHNAENLLKWKRIYYAMTANLDWNVGRLMEALEDSGAAEDTIVVFTSDHGEMFGAHGRMKKNIFYDEAARVPMIMRWPGRIPRGHVSDVCFNTVDIMPTLLGLSGLSTPVEVEGMDLSRQARGLSGPEPEAAWLMNTGACAIWEDGHEWRALRTVQFTYAVLRGWEAKDLPRRELLFDNEKDPLQMNNLADLPEYDGKMKEFREMMAKRMTSLNDTFPPSTWYRDNWIENRIIKRTATMG